MKDREKQVYDSIYKVTYTEYLLKLKSDSSTKDIAEDIADNTNLKFIADQFFGLLFFIYIWSFI